MQWGETGIWFQMRIEVFMSLVVILFFQELNADDRWPSDGAHRRASWGLKPLGCLIRADACLAASHVSGFGLRRPEHLD